MSIELLIYLADLVERIGGYAIFLNIAMPVCLLFLLIASAIQSDIDRDQKLSEIFSHNFSYFKKFFIVGLCFAFFHMFAPSKNTIYLMTATSVAKEMGKSEEFKSLYEKSFQLINKKIDEELNKESRGENK